MRLEEICTVFTDGDWIESKDQSDDGIRLIQTGNIGEGIYLEKEARAKYISEEIFGKLKCTEIFPGDILVSRLPDPVGRACIIPEKEERMITAVDCTICRPNESIISKEYLCYFMRSSAYYKKLLGSVTGTTRKRISRKNLGNVELEVPSKERQMDVVEQLDCLVKVIESRKQELQLLDTLIKARFVEMFGDPITNPKGYINLTVAEAIEAGYIEKPFDGNHGNKHPKASEYVESGIPFLMANNVIDGNVDLVNCSFITEERANKLDKGFAKDKDVLITHKGTIGRTAVLRTDYEFIMLTPQVTAYRVKKGIAPDYLCGYFTTEYFQNDMRLLAAAGGSTRAYVGITAQLQLRLIIPPLDEQKVYTDFVHQVNKSKVVVQKALDETQILFNSLMQQYFG